MQEPNYYSILTYEVLYSKELSSSEKLLYATITSLSQKDGYCYANNETIASLYGTTEVTISRQIKNLKDNGFIEIEYERNGSSIKKRKIYPLTKMLMAVNKNDNGTVNKNVKENNINNNNIESNIIIIEKFEKFYSEYPRKVKKDLVRKWFNKNKPDDELFDTIMKSLNKFKNSYDWIKQNGQFIPYPSSWLNEKRWEDEFDEPEKKENEEEQSIEVFDFDWLNEE